MQLFSGSFAEVELCSEEDLPAASCSSPVLKWQETEQAAEWPVSVKIANHSFNTGGLQGGITHVKECAICPLLHT